jgi:small subunit ribosomal protein S1
VKKDEKGATVQLQYGLEAYAPARHLRTEDEKPINVEDVKEFMIIEFDRSEKRILVSHTRVWEQAKAEEKEAVAKEKRADADKTRKAVKNIQSKVEKATLGDLGALAELREKLKQSEGGEKKEGDQQ